MAKTVIDIDEEALALAAKVLGTKTKKDTVNTALQEIADQHRRIRALENWVRLGEEGAFDKALEPGFKAEVRKGRGVGSCEERNAS
jgi:Arc/MetJ family transcription regulator